MNNMMINQSGRAQLDKSSSLIQKSKVDAFAPRFEDILKSKDRAELEKVAKEFEELFVGVLMKNMRSTILKSDISKSSYQKEIFESMLDDEYSKEIASTGSFGIGKLIIDNFEKYLSQEEEPQKTKGFDVKI